MPVASGSTLSILVVEDDPAVGELLRSMVNDISGWGATVVRDAAGARAVFRHVRVEVLVVDVNLPGISGVQLLELLRRDPQWDEPPVILISANVDQPEIRTAVARDESVQFIPKPFDVDRLIDAVYSAVVVYQDRRQRERARRG